MMKDKVGIVTGGASGIGEAIVRRLLDDGARVYAVDRDAAAIARLGEQCRDRAFAGIVGDVTSPATADEAVSRAVRESGRLDYLVNVAGVVQPPAYLSDLSIDDFDRVQAINLKGSFVFYRATVRAMIDSGKPGAIVNISSTAGIRPVPRSGSYVAAKHGLVGLTTTGALETAAHGIRVNCVCPGVTDTPLFRANAKGGAVEGMIKAIPLQRLAKSEEIAAATVWLLSDEASYVTGAVLPVDGGLALV